MRRIIWVLTIALAAAASGTAQTGGSHTVEKSVIAGGGGTSSGGSYQLEGTIGQAVAGGAAAGSPYSLQSGFWSSNLAPTAAAVFVEGRVTSLGRPVQRAFVMIALGDGTIRMAQTNTFGRFRIEDIAAGQTVIVDVQHRRYRFAPQLLDLADSVSGLELQAL